jgi:hypothetical protein
VTSIDRAFAANRKYRDADTATSGPIEDYIADAIDEAVAEEREACAVIADGCKPAGRDPIGPLHGAGMAFAAEHIAGRIRARGQSTRGLA